MARTLRTIEGVVEKLGGPEMLGAKFGFGRTAVVNWINREGGGFPAHTFVPIQEMLKAKGFRADPSLWRMKQVKERVSA